VPQYAHHCVLAGKVEDRWGSCSSDSLTTCWGATQTDHCHPQGHVGSTGGTLSICRLI